MNAKRIFKNSVATRALIYAIVALVIYSTVAVIGIYAKYTVGEEAKGEISSPQFYFTSDLLSETPPTYTLNPGQDGTTSFSFDVRNYADALRYSSDDITYTVYVNGEIKETGTLTGNTASNATVTVSLANGGSHTVSVTGSAGFESTLFATVVVNPDDTAIYYNVKKEAEYLLLTVWTKNISGTVTIIYPQGLIPDGTDKVMRDQSSPITDAESFASPYSSHVYRFFFTSEVTADFAGKITINGTTVATEATPE